MRIGTMFFGTVDALDGESIQTKFLVVGVPIAPLSSHYVMSDHGTGISGFDIPLHGKSILLGYTRIAAWMITAICGVLWLALHEPGYMAWTLGFAALTIVSTWVLGRLSRAERTRRSMLKLVTGCGAPPALLGDRATELGDRLRARWEKDHDGQAWDRAIELGAADPLLFAVAEYHLRPDLAQAVLAKLAGAAAGAPSDGPYR